MEQLTVIKPHHISQYRYFKPGKIVTLKRHHYHIEDKYSITGDAPKQFIRVYEYGMESRKSKLKSWPLYIAKTAEKWYPTESIMEHLLNRLGTFWHINMAKSRLIRAGGQIRFLSRYFLKEGIEELAHGAEILAGYFNDKDFIEEIERQGKEREFINVQVFNDALRFTFPGNYEEIFKSFVKMLLFDALVGNNDRHFYNYGVIRDLTSREKPRFSPVYDTARGLFWNVGEKQLVSLYKNYAQCEQYIQKYTKQSMPKISWEGYSNINHFDMVRLIKESFIPTVLQLPELREFFDANKMAACLTMIDQEFSEILSPERLAMIKRCLSVRLETINSIIL